MNPQAHRLIFNARRGQLMAVAETASTQGKSASGESSSTGAATVVSCIALAFSLFQTLLPPAQTASNLSNSLSIRPIALITPALTAIYSGVTTLLQTSSRFSVTVGRVSGNVTLSGKNYVQTGSDVSTPKGDITINAQNVAITEARESSNSQTQTKFSQSGITVALSNAVVGAVQSADQLRQAASKTSDGRMQALAAGSAALGAKSAVTDKDGKFDADKASSVSVSVSLGQSKSQSNSTTTADTAAASTLTAGGQHHDQRQNREWG